MASILEDRFEEREALIAELEVNGHLNDPRVEEAMLAVPRHLFVPDELADSAYQDKPLPVGNGQTISAPHMVAMMTSALMLEPGDRVLEIGGGRGYHAAVLAEMVGPKGHVTTIEYVPELAEAARERLAEIDSKVEVVTGDGFDGYPRNAPYDAILVTCAIPTVPDALLEQMAKTGHIVAPVGSTQSMLTVLRKVGKMWQKDEMGPCLFVPARGRLGGENPDESSD